MSCSKNIEFVLNDKQFCWSMERSKQFLNLKELTTGELVKLLRPEAHEHFIEPKEAITLFFKDMDDHYDSSDPNCEFPTAYAFVCSLLITKLSGYQIKTLVNRFEIRVGKNSPIDFLDFLNKNLDADINLTDQSFNNTEWLDKNSQMMKQQPNKWNLSTKEINTKRPHIPRMYLDGMIPSDLIHSTRYMFKDHPAKLKTKTIIPVDQTKTSKKRMLVSKGDSVKRIKMEDELLTLCHINDPKPLSCHTDYYGRKNLTDKKVKVYIELLHSIDKIYLTTGNRPINLLILDGPEMCATQHLLAERNDKIHCIHIPNPFHAKEMVQVVRSQGLQDKVRLFDMYMHQLISGKYTSSRYDLVWADYDRTFNGDASAKWSPRTDMKLLFDHHCLNSYVHIAITVVWRSKDRLEHRGIKNEICQFSEPFQYRVDHGATVVHTGKVDVFFYQLNRNQSISVPSTPRM